ncbi:hypothetical protein, partial [Nocardioides sp.]|uniref:hypothetical protein n=1 Tax=Nocardioides sp. TaxID=35761 RepID=UPI002734AE84
MGFCIRCGFELGIGRFCTNCGHPVAEGTVPDESGGSAPPEIPGAPVGSAAPVAPEPALPATFEPGARRPRWIPYVLVGVVLGLLLAVVVWRLASGDERA